ncbi:MAG: lipid A deacylase LpxR family protein [Sphingobacteriia bacterium]|nr:lipid A deacylase LpxR family protein [Sphingobacteriia bacterium]
MHYKIILIRCALMAFLWGLGFDASSQIQSGDAFTREFSFKTENDAYLFKLDDAYYTNGILLNYGFVTTRKGRKKIHSLELGQKIFTPLIRRTVTPADIDRPYCGYTYLNYTQTVFLKHDALFQWNGSLGLLGPASGGEAMQNTYHRWLNYARFTGWQYQIENALSVDLGAGFAKTILRSDLFKMVPVVQANLGATYTQARLGALLVLGAFEQNNESALWNARLSEKAGTKKRNHEFFLYWYPQGVLQGYNGTLQGGLFSKGTTAVTREPATFVFQQTIGACYAEGRWTGKLEWVYQSKETPAQTRAHRYGGIQLAYRIH